MNGSVGASSLMPVSSLHHHLHHCSKKQQQQQHHCSESQHHRTSSLRVSLPLHLHHSRNTGRIEALLENQRTYTSFLAMVPLFLFLVVRIAASIPHPTSTGPCHPNPCHNGGVCEHSETYRGDTFVGYLCRCPLGFDGVHCQHNVNECEKNPCKNGGSCTDLRANYTCQCPGEYMGRNCQYSK
ncbi:EGF-like repeat and discoidin I-like domain-containing protein 3 [Anabarilius grahami]|uniref:EGF-like repeat and discoidin I-like domain-containing protein 3 n=1 Tax=Anabarilius grahami TaxID=495550 RepID=A0A3N0Z726_ANAGA|nr:EGF-like repeat and discoidin I-like domain-containing protein 3 [Anabarilius grahami]